MKRGRPKSKGGLRIDIDCEMLSDPAISAATIALVNLIAKRIAANEVSHAPRVPPKTPSAVAEDR